MLPRDPDLQSYNVMAADFSRGPFSLDRLWRAMRKLSKENALSVLHNLIRDPGLDFGKLQELTLLETNALNHTLIDMKNLDLIIYEDKKYYPSIYCVAVISALDNLLVSLKDEVPSNKYDKDSSRDVKESEMKGIH